MESDSGSDPSPTPKLSLHSFPTKPPEPPGLITPPLQTLASVPFLWEEAPGKPRLSPDTTTTPAPAKPKAARCLDLPPRLLSEVKITSMPSPTTVLDGPYDVGRSLSLTWSFRRGKKECGKVKVSNFGSLRWGHGHHHNGNNKASVEGSFDFLSTPENVNEVVDDIVYGDGDGHGGSGETKVNITSVKRRRSFLRIPHPSSHLWASIYESFKQVVPWRRKQDKI